MRTISVFSSVVLAFGLAACSDETETPDAGVEDARVVDAGSLPLCPVIGYACAKAVDCAPEGTAPSNCGSFCPNYDNSLCKVGECSTPSETAVVNLQFEVEQYVIDRAMTYVGVAIAKTTAGGLVRTCADGKLEEFSSCMNVVDVRQTDKPPSGANGTQIPFRVPVGEPLIFHVYGFPVAPAEGAPIGFSCTEYTAESANPADPDIPGDRMKQIR